MRWKISEAYFPYPVQSSQFARVWQVFKMKFKCQRCGGCCDGSIGTKLVAVDKQDIEEIRIAKGVSRNAIKRLTITDGNKRFLPTPCPMLIGNQCSVYYSRPKSCRTFPWIDDTIIKGVRCPTINTGCPAIKEVYGFDKLDGVQETHPGATEKPEVVRSNV